MDANEREWWFWAERRKKGPREAGGSGQPPSQRPCFWSKLPAEALAKAGSSLGMTPGRLEAWVCDRPRSLALLGMTSLVLAHGERLRE